jgi:DNA-binding PadR family transcriptional regulator
VADDTPFTPLRLAILGLIYLHPQSGYDLRKIFTTTPMGNFSSSPGAIYPALKSLERKGWIRGKKDKEESLRPRLVYSLTEEGRVVLLRELAKPVTRDDVIWHFDELILRFAFMEQLPRRQTLKFLNEFLIEVESYARSLEPILEELKGQPSVTGRLALEQGIESYRANARWARRAIRELERLENQEGGEHHE